MKTELEKLEGILIDVKDTLFYNDSVSNITYEKVCDAQKIVNEMKTKFMVI